MNDLSEKTKDQLFKEFYLRKETISFLCEKYKITRYRFYKLKNSYSKKSFYDYQLEDWVQACLEENPDASLENIRRYLSYVNKVEYSLKEIQDVNKWEL